MHSLWLFVLRTDTTNKRKRCWHIRSILLETSKHCDTDKYLQTEKEVLYRQLAGSANVQSTWRGSSLVSQSKSKLDIHVTLHVLGWEVKSVTNPSRDIPTGIFADSNHTPVTPTDLWCLDGWWISRFLHQRILSPLAWCLCRINALMFSSASGVWLVGLKRLSIVW